MKSFMQKLMSEMISYGGMAATREEVYADALEVCTKQAATQTDCETAAKAGRKAAEQFAFGRRAKELTPEEAARLPRFDPQTRCPVAV